MTKRWKAFLTGVLAVWFASSILGKIQYAASIPTNDFFYNWIVSRNLEKLAPEFPYSLAGQKRIWSLLSELRNATEPDIKATALIIKPLWFTQPPFLAFCYRVLGFGAPGVDHAIFLLVSTAAFIMALLVFGRWWGYSNLRLLVFGILVFEAYYPLLSEYANCSFARIQLGAVVLALWLRFRRTPWALWASGWLWGVTLMVKPVLIFCPLFLFFDRFFRREYRAVLSEGLGMACGGLLAMGGGCFAFGSCNIWFIWLGWLKHLPPQAIPVFDSNFSIPNLLLFQGDIKVGWLLLGVLFAGALLLIYASFSEHPGKQECSIPALEADFTHWGPRSLCLVSFGIILYLAGSNLVWIHYHTYSLPLLIQLFRPISPSLELRYSEYLRRTIGISGTFLVALAPFFNLSIAKTHALIGLGTSLMLVFAALELWSISRNLFKICDDITLTAINLSEHLFISNECERSKTFIVKKTRFLTVFEMTNQVTNNP